MKIKKFELIAKFVYLLCLIIVEINALEVNLMLQTNVTCSVETPCAINPGLKQWDCNIQGKCQCLFPYYPISEYKDGIYDKCKLANCENTETCQAIYEDTNVTCLDTTCYCITDTFYNYDFHKCKYSYEKQRTRIGDQCDENSLCAGLSKCSPKYGVCVCPPGYIAESGYFCKIMYCDSDEYCRQKVRPSVACVQYSYGKRCGCPRDYKEDLDSGICIPKARKIGESCNGTDDDLFGCGERATCSRITNKCACYNGFIKKSNGIDCDPLTCASDIDCLELDPHSFCTYNKFCGCQEGYNDDYSRDVCQKDDNTFKVIFWPCFSLLCFAFISFCGYKVYQGRKRRNQTDRSPLPYTVPSTTQPSNPAYISKN